MDKIHFLIAVLLISWYCLACNSSENNSSLANQDLSKIQLLPCSPIDTFAFYKKIKMQNYSYDRGTAMFGTQGIRLGAKIPVEGERASSLTKKGVHLHLNINNTIHEISNENNFPCTIPDGRHKLFAFIATPYYESIKNQEAIIAKEIEIRNNRLARSHNLSQVDIVYNAPRGELKGGKVLLDFVLVNTSLAKGGNSVRVTIDEGAVFTLNDWQAYYIEGLVEGTHTVKLELLDATGKQIALPIVDTFNLIKESIKN